MKKMLLAVVSVFFVLSIFSVGVASAAEVKAKGTLKSIDAAKGTIVFCADGGKDVTIKATADQLKTVKANDKIKITYDDKTNTVSKITKDRKATVPVGC